MIQVETVIVGQLEVNCYVLYDGQTREACVIDPGDEPDLIMNVISGLGLRPLAVLCTHAHYDHICAARELRDRYGLVLAMHGDETQTYARTAELCRSWGYEPDDFPAPDRLLSDGDLLKIGSLDIRVIHTPGHSPGSVCFHTSGTLFSGDTLFRGTVGRTDLPGGDGNALLRSLARLAALPPETNVLCGHDQPTVLADEIKRNPFFREVRAQRKASL